MSSSRRSKSTVTRTKLERIYGECFDIVEHLAKEALQRMGEGEEKVQEFQRTFGEIAAEHTERMRKRAW